MFKAFLPQPIVSHLSSQVGLMDTPAFPFKTIGLRVFATWPRPVFLFSAKDPQTNLLLVV